MPQQPLLPTERHDSQARVKTIYGRVAEKLEPSFKGKSVAIEVESGEYFVGETVLDAAGKVHVKYPDKVFHFFHIGSLSVYGWR